MGDKPTFLKFGTISWPLRGGEIFTRHYWLHLLDWALRLRLGACVT